MWRLPYRRSQWDSLFRGKAQVLAKQRPKIAGASLDDWQLQTLAMAPAGATVRAKVRQSEISLETTHDALIELNEINKVVLKRDAKGLFIYVDLMLFSSAGKKGFGATAFLRMAQTAQRLGFERVDLLAAGGTGYKHSWSRSFNGYYSWARFGFDSDLWPATLAKLTTHGGPLGARTLLDIIESDPAWWKTHGDGCDLTFDLRRGSRSWHTLYTYLDMKGD